MKFFERDRRIHLVLLIPSEELRERGRKWGGKKETNNNTILPKRSRRRDKKKWKKKKKKNKGPNHDRNGLLCWWETLLSSPFFGNAWFVIRSLASDAPTESSSCWSHEGGPVFLFDSFLINFPPSLCLGTSFHRSRKNPQQPVESWSHQSVYIYFSLPPLILLRIRIQMDEGQIQKQKK